MVMFVTYIEREMILSLQPQGTLFSRRKIMLQMNINEIKTHLSATLVKVEQGETVIICKRNKPVAQIKSIKQQLRQKRPIGLAGDEYPEFRIDDDFFEPLPDDILTGFTGEK